MNKKFAIGAAAFILAQAMTGVAFGQACPPGPTAANAQAGVCIGFANPEYTNPVTHSALYTFGSKPVGPYIGDYNQVTQSQPFVNDDYTDPTPHPTPFGSQVTWNTTTYTADYLGMNWATVGSTTKYGSNALIGIEGYAQIANLAMYMLSNNSSNYTQVITTTVDGLPVHTTIGALEQALNEAIFWISTPGSDHISGSNWYIGATQNGGDTLSTLAKQFVVAVQADFNTTATATAGLESAFDNNNNGVGIWLFTPGSSSTNLEEWTILPNVPNVPEGGSILGYLLMACGACFVACVFARRQGRNQISTLQAL